MSTDRDEILRAAANGNGSALDFLRAFARRAHWVDDLLDEPNALRSAEGMASRESEWLLMLTGNVWFIEHRAKLVPAMVLALNAWVDSEQMRNAECRMQNAADVVKGQWHEVVWLVAWLTGGWEKMRAVSTQYRAYDFEPQRRGDAEKAPVNEEWECSTCRRKSTTDRIFSRYSPLNVFCSEECVRGFSLNGKEANGLPG